MVADRLTLLFFFCSFRYVGSNADNITCGGLGLNFNSLRGVDLNFTDTAGVQWLINPCGEIQNTVCANAQTTEKGKNNHQSNN